MNLELQANLRRVGIRFLCVAPLMVVGFYLMLSLGTILFGCALLIISGMIVAFPVAELCARPLMAFYFPTEAEAGPPPPNYSIPEARVKQGRYEEAMRAYEEIAARYPQETRAYCGMIEIAFRYLRDSDRAGRIHARALAALHQPEAQASLQLAFQAHRSWFQKPPR